MRKDDKRENIVVGSLSMLDLVFPLTYLYYSSLLASR